MFKHITFIQVLVLLLMHVCIGNVVASQQNSQPANSERANQILRQIDDMWRGDSSYAVIHMRVKTAHYERNMTMHGWSKGKEKSLVKIVAPLKEKGTATLKSGNRIFTYLPKTDRTIRLTSGMMMGSWMGSHFTNDDLVKESRREDDFHATISFEGERDNRKILEFSLMPKEDAAVVWGKLVLIVDAENLLPIYELYYDEDLQLSRKFVFSDVKQLAGMPRPSVMRVIPQDKPDEFTELVYQQLELNIDIDDDFFSLANLKKN